MCLATRWCLYCVLWQWEDGPSSAPSTSPVPNCLRCLTRYKSVNNWRNENKRWTTMSYTESWFWCHLFPSSFTFSVRGSASTKARCHTSSLIWRLWVSTVLHITTLQTLVHPLYFNHIKSYICCIWMKTVGAAHLLFIHSFQSSKWHLENTETWTLFCLRQSKVECVHWRRRKTSVLTMECWSVQRSTQWCVDPITSEKMWYAPEHSWLVHPHCILDIPNWV